jgi:hypothetical protein
MEASGRWPGVFRLAGAPGPAIAGELDLSGRWPVVRLGSELTPALVETDVYWNETGEVVTKWSSAPAGREEECFAVHGELVDEQNLVTLLDAFTIGRADAGQQVQGRYALLGAHLDAAATYSAARVGIRHLASWVGPAGLSLTQSHGGERIDIGYKRPEPLSENLIGVAGSLGLVCTATLDRRNEQGAAVHLDAALELQNLEPSSIEDVWRLVEPLAILLTLAIDAAAVPQSLQLYSDVTGGWVDVADPRIEQAPVTRSIRPWHVLLPASTLTLTHVVTWLSRYEALRPIPELVSSVIDAPARSVEGQMLDLCTAVEGLHRRLSASQLKYAERLQALLDRAAIGNVIGGYDCDAQAEWIRLVRNTRNHFAHRIEQPTGTSGDDRWGELQALVLSLRWLLTSLLLQETGLDTDALRRRLIDHDSFRTAHRQLRIWWPDIYGPWS